MFQNNKNIKYEKIYKIYIYTVEEQNNFCSNNISKTLGIPDIIIRVFHVDKSYY